MKKSDIEKRLKSDLESATPANFDAVWKKCVREDYAIEKRKAAERQLVAAGANGGTVNGRGKSFAFAALALAFVLAVSLVFGAAMGWFGKDDPFKLSKGYFILDINPSVEVDYDENGKVTDTVGLNGDGKVLLHGLEASLVGKTYEETVEILFDRCVLLGYFSADFDNNAVLVSATKSSGGTDVEMTERVRGLFSERFVNKKICGVAIAGKDDPEVADQAAGYGIDAQKYALILEYLALAEQLGEEIEISESEYATIPVREIYEEIEDLREDIEEFEIGDKASDEIEEIIKDLENAADDAGVELDLEALEEEAESIENAKTFAECRACAESVLSKLQAIKEDAHDSVLKGLIDEACSEIERVMEGLSANEEKLSASVEDRFAEREDKYKDNVDKEAETPDGGFEAWQSGKEKEMHGSSWRDFKNDWKNGRDD